MKKCLALAVLLGNLVACPALAGDDDFKAVMFWAKRGLPDYQFKAGQLYEEGRHTPKDPAQAREWYKRSAANGYRPAIEKLKAVSASTRTSSTQKQPGPLTLQRNTSGQAPADRAHLATGAPGGSREKNTGTPPPVKTVPLVITKPAAPPVEKQAANQASAKTADKPASKPGNASTATRQSSAAPVSKPATRSRTAEPGGAAKSALAVQTQSTLIKRSSKSDRPETAAIDNPDRLIQAKAAPVLKKPKKSSRRVQKAPKKTRHPKQAQADTVGLTLDTLLARHWITDNGQPAAYLPSFITHCTSAARGTECWSREHRTQLNGKPVDVKTRSYIRDFSASGFSIRYRHMLLGSAGEGRRWEDKTHRLDCRILHTTDIQCDDKDNHTTVQFSQLNSEQLSGQFSHNLLTSAKWMINNQPATFLPSYITTCQSDAGRLSCWSQARKLRSADDPATIKTRAHIGQIQDGKFVVKYRNLVMVAPGSSDWENKTHEARCSIQGFDRITCTEDNQRLTYTKDIQEF